MEFKQRYNSYFDYVEKKIKELFVIEDVKQKTVLESMNYSLLAGGKRLRPVFMLAVTDLLGKDKDYVCPLAVALEMIHTYSLIHDDLPAMDNDDFRRGKPTNHKVYGEAVAVLAGDGLLNKAFEVMLNNKYLSELDTNKYIKAMSFIGNSSGVNGMIGGQIVDIESEGKTIDIDTLKYMHKCKTGELFRASILPPAILFNSGEIIYENLEKYADNIGLAFQIKDDILDVEGNSEIMGKPKGSDDELNKSTFVSIYGLEKSKEFLNEVTDEALKSLDGFGDNAIFLKQIAEYLVSRER